MNGSINIAVLEVHQYTKIKFRESCRCELVSNKYTDKDIELYTNILLKFTIKNGTIDLPNSSQGGQLDH